MRNGTLSCGTCDLQLCIRPTSVYSHGYLSQIFHADSIPEVSTTSTQQSRSLCTTPSTSSIFFATCISFPNLEKPTRVLLRSCD
ncbi:hypothetical protein BD309DRAFT_950487 [Dichomitus squalens]|nr:hypothetical protein BD309DRAFT_950487 [Dichomitus squalens]